MKHMQRDCYPLVVNLPDGKRAEYVDGSRPARYTVDGKPTAIDVTIPDELAQSGWYWSGSFLYQPWLERGDGPGVAISTGTYGVPGYPNGGRDTCFEVARYLDGKRVEVAAALAARPAKKVRAGKKTIAIPDVPIEAIPEPELIAEQMELAL